MPTLEIRKFFSASIVRITHEKTCNIVLTILWSNKHSENLYKYLYRGTFLLINNLLIYVCFLQQHKNLHTSCVNLFFVRFHYCSISHVGCVYLDKYISITLYGKYMKIFVEIESFWVNGWNWTEMVIEKISKKIFEKP